MNKQPLISIIITSYTPDRLKDIIELLDSIKTQTYFNTETIFVVEHSRELEKRVQTHIQNTHIPSVKVVFHEGEPGASAARNLGIDQCHGDIIAFVDDDVILPPGWANEMVKTYEDAEVTAVTGISFPLWRTEAASWLPEELYWLISCTGWSRFTETTEVRNIWLQNASFRKEAFDQAGLINTELGPRDGGHAFKSREFKEGIISEEIELSMRIRQATGKRIVCNPRVVIYHKVYSNRLRTGYITRWSFWTGLSKHKTKKLYVQSDNGLLNTEYDLLKRILIRRLPLTLFSLFRHPVHAGRRLYVILLAMFFVALGYISYSFSPSIESRSILIEQKGS